MCVLGRHQLFQRFLGFGLTRFLELDCLLEPFLSPWVRFKRGFESEPTLHSGINYAVLLLAAGHQFDTSFELRKVGEATTAALLDTERSFYDLGRFGSCRLLTEVRGRQGVMWVEPPGSGGWKYPSGVSFILLLCGDRHNSRSKRCRTGFTVVFLRRTTSV